jgi:hypothetical protein
MKPFAQILALSAAFICSHAAQAHHSFAATFTENVIEVEGVITKFSFRNPHILVYIDVTNGDGSVTNWMSEGSAANLYRRSGWDASTLESGNYVRIVGHSTHDGSPMVSIDTVNLIDPADGSVIADLSRDFRAGQQKAVRAADMPLEMQNGWPNLAGAWTSHGVTGERPRGIEMSRTNLAEVVQANFDRVNDPQIFCDEPGLVRQIQTPHPYRITQNDDHVVFEYEEYAGRREVYFNGRNVLGVRSHFGDSIARYEGNSLIVETGNLMANPTSPTGNVLSNEATIVEIYTRTDTDEYGPMVTLTTNISDPLHLTESASFSRVKMSAGEYDFIENDCQQPLRERETVSPEMNFFLTSYGLGDGANLGGLEGADAQCVALASEVGQADKNWQAYLSTTGEGGVNARDRIGVGPWYNAKGALVATNLDQLHSEQNWLTKATATDQLGREFHQIDSTVQDDGMNSRHDILTGSELDGTASDAVGDTTCSNWTSNADGSALIGHGDRRGGGVNPTSWNNAHATRGCSPDLLASSDGAGLFYCFATGE